MARGCATRLLLGDTARNRRSRYFDCVETIMPSNRLKRSLTTTIVVPSILVAAATLVLLWQLGRQRSETQWVEHS